MSLMKKMKDILFDEDEIIEDKKIEMPPVVPEPIIERQKPIIEKIEIPKSEPKLEETKELPSPFMDFDEDEFVNSIPHIPTEPLRSDRRVKEISRVAQKPMYSDVERKTSVETRVDYGRYEKVEKVEIKEKIKFKPSLIISPVYGVLNEDYIPEDIKSREEIIDALDIDEVRRKAYGELNSVEKTIDKRVETFYEEKINTSISSSYEPAEKVKTIEELLSVSADERINLNDSLYDDKFSENSELDFNDIRRENRNKLEEEDTLETDLYDLIDSMYESKEEVF